MSRPVYIAAAKRSPVCPRRGGLGGLSLSDLGGPVLASVAGTVDAGRTRVVLGNALGAGGNPARMVALAAGLPTDVAAMTVDTQCCAGLDAVALGAHLIGAGAADTVLAGGVESFSRAPLRAHRPLDPGGDPQPYDRPPFTPWADRDPDMIAAAGALSDLRGISRTRQEAFAIDSHAKHRAAQAAGAFAAEIVPLAGITADSFARDLSPGLCARLPALAGTATHAVTAATTAVEADAAACLRLSSTPPQDGPAIRLLASVSVGGDPALPGAVPSAAISRILSQNGNISPESLFAIEIMEAFAAQIIDAIDNAGLPIDRINTDGGALARGHPIGASGAILAVRLVQRLWAAPAGSLGLAAIAGAGGLATAVLMGRD